MTKLQTLYVKLDNFWDSVPKPIKIFLYGLASVLLLKLSDDLVNGVQLDMRAYLAVAGTYGYNILIAWINDLRKELSDVEGLKDEYNKSLMDR